MAPRCALTAITEAVIQRRVFRHVEADADPVTVAVVVFDERGQPITGAMPREEVCDGDDAEPWLDDPDAWKRKAAG